MVRCSLGTPSNKCAKYGRSGKSGVSYTTKMTWSKALGSRDVGTSGMSPMGSENRATSCPSDFPTLTYLVIVLMARAERSNLDTINSFIRPSNLLLDLPSAQLLWHDVAGVAVLAPSEDRLPGSRRAAAAVTAITKYFAIGGAKWRRD